MSALDVLVQYVEERDITFRKAAYAYSRDLQLLDGEASFMRYDKTTDTFLIK